MLGARFAPSRRPAHFANFTPSLHAACVLCRRPWGQRKGYPIPLVGFVFTDVAYAAYAAKRKPASLPIPVLGESQLDPLDLQHPAKS